jgi:hypothetical protein
MNVCRTRLAGHALAAIVLSVPACRHVAMSPAPTLRAHTHGLVPRSEGVAHEARRRRALSQAHAQAQAQAQAQTQAQAQAQALRAGEKSVATWTMADAAPVAASAPVSASVRVAQAKGDVGGRPRLGPGVEPWARIVTTAARAALRAFALAYGVRAAVALLLRLPRIARAPYACAVLHTRTVLCRPHYVCVCV